MRAKTITKALCPRVFSVEWSCFDPTGHKVYKFLEEKERRKININNKKTATFLEQTEKIIYHLLDSFQIQFCTNL
jgi:hypothetical protein